MVLRGGLGAAYDGAGEFGVAAASARPPACLPTGLIVDHDRFSAGEGLGHGTSG